MTLERPALLAASRLVCVDGPAGSGKTTFADGLQHAAGESSHSVSLVHLDDVYAGWSGLATVGERLRRLVVEPLLQGRTGRFPRWDWDRSGWAEDVEVPVADLVVLEGVGSGHPSLAPYVALLVWVEAADDVRLRRGLARDGAHLLPHWRAWMADETAVHERERTHERADLVVDGVTGSFTRPRSAR
jgi:uridine kinase